MDLQRGLIKYFIFLLAGIIGLANFASSLHADPGFGNRYTVKSQEDDLIVVIGQNDDEDNGDNDSDEYFSEDGFDTENEDFYRALEQHYEESEDEDASENFTDTTATIQTQDSDTDNRGGHTFTFGGGFQNRVNLERANQAINGGQDDWMDMEDSEEGDMGSEGDEEARIEYTPDYYDTDTDFEVGNVDSDAEGTPVRIIAYPPQQQNQTRWAIHTTLGNPFNHQIFQRFNEQNPFNQAAGQQGQFRSARLLFPSGPNGFGGFESR